MNSAAETIRGKRNLLLEKADRLFRNDDAGEFTTDPADAARADYLGTRNQQHFPKFWKNTKIISARDFLNIIAPHLID